MLFAISNSYIDINIYNFNIDFKIARCKNLNKDEVWVIDIK